MHDEDFIVTFPRIQVIGESNYIRAVQSLQDPKYPYCKEMEYEGVLVAIIEGHKLTVYDD